MLFVCGTDRTATVPYTLTKSWKQTPKTDWCLDFVSGNLGNHYPVMVLEYQRNGISYASFYIGILYYILIPCALHANQRRSKTRTTMKRMGIEWIGSYSLLSDRLVIRRSMPNLDGTFNRSSKMQATSPHCSSHHLEEIRGFTMFRVQILKPKSISNVVWSSNLPGITGQNRSVLVPLSVFDAANAHILDCNQRFNF